MKETFYTEPRAGIGGIRLMVRTFGDGEPVFGVLAPGETSDDLPVSRQIVLSRKDVKALRRLLKADLSTLRAETIE